MIERFATYAPNVQPPGKPSPRPLSAGSRLIGLTIILLLSALLFQGSPWAPVWLRPRHTFGRQIFQPDGQVIYGEEELDGWRVIESTRPTQNSQGGVR